MESPAFLSLYGRDGGGRPRCPQGHRRAGRSSASAGSGFANCRSCAGGV